MSKINSKMLGNVSADKIVENDSKNFVTLTQIQDIQNALSNSAHNNREILDLLSADVDGKLQYNGLPIDGQVSNVLANNVAITDTGNLFTSTNVEDVLTELFTFASNGKNQIATAITGKGVEAYSTDTFAVLSDKISSISSGSGSTIVQNTKLNVVAPYTKEITLLNTQSISNVCTSVLEYIYDTGIVKYNCNFDNTDSSDFTNNDNIIYDGTMHCKTNFIKNLASNVLTTGTLYESEDININYFNNINNFNVSNDNLTSISIIATPINQLIIANNNINLSGIDTIDTITWTSNSTGSSSALLLISFDSGTNWNAYKDNIWVTVNINDMNDVKSKGMPKSVVDTLNTEIIENLRNERISLRFAYYLNQQLVSEVANNDAISISISMPGYDVIADKNKYNLNFNNDTKVLTFNFLTDGTYTINYAD